MSPFFAPSASDLGLVAAPSDSSSPRNQPASLEVHNCAVCLSPRNQPTSLEVHNCAVCLERMDLENESLLTTVCNHSFHLDCLMQWQDSPCPVCRYQRKTITSVSFAVSSLVVAGRLVLRRGQLLRMQRHCVRAMRLRPFQMPTTATTALQASHRHCLMLANITTRLFMRMR